MLPGAFRQAVIAWQGIWVRADVGGTLHVAVAAEDIGTTTGHTDVAQRELQDAGRTHHGVANRVLGLAHAPDDGAGAVHGHGLGGLEHFGLGHAGYLSHTCWGPLLHDFLANGIHAVDTVVDVLLVLPAILEDVMQDAEQEGHISARPHTDVLVCLGRGAGEARVNNDDLAAVLLFGGKQVEHGNRMRLCGIRTDVQRCLRIAHVVVAVGHGAVAPCVGHTGHRGGVANAGLVVGVVRAQEGHELAQQVGLLVVVLGGAHHEQGIGATGLHDGLHLLGDALEGFIPADALVLAIDQLHGVTQAVPALAVLLDGRTLRTVGTQVDGGIEHGLMASPDTILDHRIDRAAHRAV